MAGARIKRGDDVFDRVAECYRKDNREKTSTTTDITRTARTRIISDAKQLQTLIILNGVNTVTLLSHAYASFELFQALRLLCTMTKISLPLLSS